MGGNTYAVDVDIACVNEYLAIQEAYTCLGWATSSAGADALLSTGPAIYGAPIYGLSTTMAKTCFSNRVGETGTLLVGCRKRNVYPNGSGPHLIVCYYPSASALPIDSDGDGTPDKHDIDTKPTDQKDIGKDPESNKINKCQNFVADPINIFNGNLVESVTDIAFPSPSVGLTFKRV